MTPSSKQKDGATNMDAPFHRTFGADEGNFTE